MTSYSSSFFCADISYFITVKIEEASPTSVCHISLKIRKFFSCIADEIGRLLRDDINQLKRNRVENQSEMKTSLVESKNEFSKDVFSVKRENIANGKIQFLITGNLEQAIQSMLLSEIISIKQANKLHMDLKTNLTCRKEGHTYYFEKIISSPSEPTFKK